MARGPKIGILTFHRCINYGSYWQARCLVEGLRACGHEAVLLDHDSAEVNRAEWRCALQPLLPTPSPLADRRLYAAKTRAFLDAFARLPLSARFRLDRPGEMEECDLVLVGSDEVWNPRHPWYGGWPIFYGGGLKTGRLAAYAASCGNHDAADGFEGWRAERLRGFAAISVRDDNSRRLVGGALGEDPELVLDPCLQFPEPVEASSSAPARQNYMVVYGHSFPRWFAEAVRRWADRQGLRLVSIGYNNAWADEQRLAAGPEEFARLIARSAAVATNFFHGCVFALLNRKPFVSAPSSYRFNKVRDLLRALGAERHMVDERTPAPRYAAALGEGLAPGVSRRIAEMRGRSARYLEQALA